MRMTMARLLGGLSTITAIAGLATVAIIATTDTISLQDVVDMTGTQSASENRWLAHVVSIPNGSTHMMVGAEDKGFSIQNINHAMGVQTAEALHVFDVDKPSKSGSAPTLARALKGDRVVELKPKTFTANLASHPHQLIATDNLIAGSLGTNKTNPLLKVALTFRQTIPVEEEKKSALKTAITDTVKSARREIGITEGQLNQARAAAKTMALALKTARNQADIASGAGVVTAYAPADSQQGSQLVSAFAAVVRPTKPDRKLNRKRIRLGKGDHKWAANKLPAKAFYKSERRCLAVGVYFEARSEPKKGQQAVAQVILNRVRNPAYPNTICRVVYQNKWRYNSCQFSFACDGKRDRIKSPRHWNIAVNIANNAIDGKFWLRSVGSSSHYHADYVRPKWRRSMRKMVKIGRHIFYRTYGGGWS